jgi:thiol-disulfide isomerase/thioredoxin
LEEVDNEDDLACVLRDNVKTFVLFYASWCPLCRGFLPVFEKYAHKNGSEHFLHVRVDDTANPLWEKYALDVVPSIIFFEGETVSSRLDGILGVGLNEQQFKNFIETVV